MKRVESIMTTRFLSSEVVVVKITRMDKWECSQTEINNWECSQRLFLIFAAKELRQPSNADEIYICRTIGKYIIFSRGDCRFWLLGELSHQEATGVHEVYKGGGDFEYRRFDFLHSAALKGDVVEILNWFWWGVNLYIYPSIQHIVYF